MRQAVLNLEESMIRQVANAGMGRSDVLKFWFGESDEVTPSFIRDAAAASLLQGETFTPTTLACPNCGKPLPAMPRHCAQRAQRPSVQTGLR